MLVNFFSLTMLRYGLIANGACLGSIHEQQLPQFQIVSAAKTGSTSLYSYLCQHPEIQCLAKKKELNILRSPEIKVKSEKVIVQKVNKLDSNIFNRIGNCHWLRI